tara:strand:+ start:6622 stop:7530 length:909 start_codon:yes stop_codon:yes gene_type:complete
MENEDSIKIPDEVRQAMKTDGPTPSASETKQARNNDSTAFQQTDTIQKTEYPSEVVDLPSKGWFYDQASPLASGRVDVKYMTAKEEDILTSQNLIKKGIVLDKLLEQLIISPGVKLDDILVGDKNAIFIAARVLAYGKEYKIKFKDPSTGDDVEDTIDLTQLNPREINFENFNRGDNIFEYTLPHSERVLHWKLLTHQDEQAIDAELKGLKKFTKNKNQTSEVTTRLKYVIKALDGDDDRAKIKSFVDKELLARDSLAFREHIKENTPDLDMTFNFESEDTGYTERMTIPLGVDFFYPSTGV